MEVMASTTLPISVPDAPGRVIDSLVLRTSVTAVEAITAASAELVRRRCCRTGGRPRRPIGGRSGPLEANPGTPGRVPG